VFSAYRESHTNQVPFHAVTRVLRAATRVEGLDGQTARDRVRDRVPDADPEDLLLLHDLLGIADPDVEPPKIDPDARRRRLTALVNAASLARKTPAVVEDAHWIDAVSESMLAEFLMVIAQTPSLFLVTYRPEYEGALSRVHGAQTIALAPLSNSETADTKADHHNPSSPTPPDLAVVFHHVGYTVVGVCGLGRAKAFVPVSPPFRGVVSDRDTSSAGPGLCCRWWSGRHGSRSSACPRRDPGCCLGKAQ
jgi:hypothetical protein